MSRSDYSRIILVLSDGLCACSSMAEHLTDNEVVEGPIPSTRTPQQKTAFAVFCCSILHRHYIGAAAGLTHALQLCLCVATSTIAESPTRTYTTVSTGGHDPRSIFTKL